ncbi:MAG: hypothetical protein M9928_15535 [Anaerolineae bacterium]|nr:hypothetical protein [Anaerolineae bacterium]MCO5194575.1 hypothetical protein [Anaerolineae bacterium]MCO5199200.1 hypothetical protein [Anaerolineae bacterium]MCO5206448.1 hypothetical protein [Anaerolineae bacterium]
MILFCTLGGLLLYAYVTMQPQPPNSVLYIACFFLLIGIGDLVVEILDKDLL